MCDGRRHVPRQGKYGGSPKRWRGLRCRRRCSCPAPRRGEGKMAAAAKMAAAEGVREGGGREEEGGRRRRAAGSRTRPQWRSFCSRGRRGVRAGARCGASPAAPRFNPPSPPVPAPPLLPPPPPPSFSSSAPGPGRRSSRSAWVPIAPVRRGAAPPLPAEGSRDGREGGGWQRGPSGLAACVFGVKECVFGVGARVSQSLSVGVSQGGREVR